MNQAVNGSVNLRRAKFFGRLTLGVLALKLFSVWVINHPPPNDGPPAGAALFLIAFLSLSAFQFIFSLIAFAFSLRKSAQTATINNLRSAFFGCLVLSILGNIFRFLAHATSSEVLDLLFGYGQYSMTSYGSGWFSMALGGIVGGIGAAGIILTDVFTTWRNEPP